MDGGDQYRLVRNAVPVELAQVLGQHIRTTLEANNEIMESTR